MPTLTRTERVLRLVQLLGRGGQTLAQLTGSLGVTERTFFRDLALLRGGGFAIELTGKKYHLRTPGGLVAKKNEPLSPGAPTGKRTASGRRGSS